MMFAAMTRLPFNPSHSVLTCRHPMYTLPLAGRVETSSAPAAGGWYLASSSVPITQLLRPSPHRRHKTSNNWSVPFAIHQPIQSPGQLDINLQFAHVGVPAMPG
ncbi:unnamed protein product [Ectocarpus fasciculatus]